MNWINFSKLISRAAEGLEAAAAAAAAAAEPSGRISKPPLPRRGEAGSNNPLYLHIFFCYGLSAKYRAR